MHFRFVSGALVSFAYVLLKTNTRKLVPHYRPLWYLFCSTRLLRRNAEWWPRIFSQR